MGINFNLILCLLIFGSLTSARLWKAGDPCPSEIDTTVSGYYEYKPHPGEPEVEPELGTMSAVHAALLNCPNIESLQLRVAAQGCSEWPDRWNFPFDASGTEKYPPNLQVLSLDGYDFDQYAWGEVQPPTKIHTDTLDAWAWWVQSGKVWKYLQWRFLPAGQQHKRNIDLWLDAMDFSHIHTLSLNRQSHESVSKNVTLLLPPRLTNLSSLTVAGPTAHEFILQLQKDLLKSLAWLGPKTASNLMRVLEHHGSSLRHLTWYSDELTVFPRPMLSLEQVQQFVLYAPEIQTLAIDMGRNGTWPWDHLRSIVTGLPRLTNLTLYFDLQSECRQQTSSWVSCEGGCYGVHQYQQPMLNRTTAVELAEFLQNHTISEALSQVTFRSGDWSPPWDGPLYFPEWLEGKRVSMDCSLGRETNGSSRVLCEGHDIAIDHDRSQYCEEYDTVR